MKLNKVTILGFKNIAQTELTLTSRINAFVGRNGAGKTNLLDAVHYLAMGKSLMSSDAQSLGHDADFFLIDGTLQSDTGKIENIVCGYKQGGKSLRRDGKEYEKLSDHIGLVPLVVVSPWDTVLVSDSAEERRRYLNNFLSQTNHNYLSQVIKYNHIMAERNRLLKHLDPSIEEILDVLDMQLVASADVIYPARAAIVEALTPLVAEYYAVLSGDAEKVSISYKSELNERPFAQILRENRRKDLINTHTTSGIHRDDIVMQIGGYPIRRYGSQGQQKSLVVALKLAQYKLLGERSGEKPILLLDDLFDKLDVTRIERLLNLLCGGEFGQVFITDCNKVRLEAILEGIPESYTLFNVTDGGVAQ